MIDIQKLKQFPLAFKAFENYIEKQYGSVLFIYNGSGVVKNEDCLLFLDNKDIFVNICGCAKVWQSKTYTHIDGIYGEIDNLNFSKSRIGCSEKAIEVAFELLEIKLKTN